MSNDPAARTIPLGTVLCPSGRLTLCDWVLAGDWAPDHSPLSTRDPDGPRLTIREDRRIGSAAVIDGLRPDVACPVTGEFFRDDRVRGSLRRVEVSIRDGVAAERIEIGTISVLYGRLVVADALVDLSWDADASLDGLADVTFWGRHGAEVAAAVGTSPVLSPRDHGVFG